MGEPHSLPSPAGDTGRRLLITGASGYIGSRLCAMAAAAGTGLVLLGRHPPPAAPDAARFHAFSLGDSPPDEAFDGVAAVIHLALAGAGGDSAEEANVGGTRRLIEAARRHGIPRFVFVSSQSARADAPTAYGRVKWAAEQHLGGAGEVAVRPGLVYGGTEKGLFGTLCRLVRASPLLPVPGADAPIQPIHVDELCRALLRIADAATPPRPLYHLGATEPIPFRRFLLDLARARFGRRIRILPIPLSVALAGAALAGRIPGLSAFSRDRVLGVAGLAAMGTADSLAALGLDLAPPAAALAGEARRPVLREGRTLLAYVMGGAPPGSLVRRYARAIGAVGDGAPAVLPAVVHRWPALLGLWDPPGRAAGGELSLGERMHAALVIAETTPAGARRFCALETKSRGLAILELAALVAGEAVLLPARLLLARMRK